MLPAALVLWFWSSARKQQEEKEHEADDCDDDIYHGNLGLYVDQRGGNHRDDGNGFSAKGRRDEIA